MLIIRVCNKLKNTYACDKKEMSQELWFWFWSNPGPSLNKFNRFNSVRFSQILFETQHNSTNSLMVWFGLG